MVPGGLRVGEVQERNEYQSLGDHVDRVGEVLHADRRAGLRRARRQPPRQHEGAQDQHPVEAEHEPGDLYRQAGFEQSQLHQDEAENPGD